MCIITGPVNSVKSTKIFVAPSKTRNYQLVIYSNIVSTAAKNMMILPVPNPHTVQFEEGVMLYTNIFRDAEDSFYNPYESLSLSRGPTPGMNSDPLPVLNVGSYQASIALSVTDLTRLNANVFNITPELIQMLKRNYETLAMGFVCCVLRPGGNQYEPIAYTHQCPTSGKLFVPTKHYHPDARINLNSAYGTAWAMLQQGDSYYADDWDHRIYSVGTTRDSAHLNWGELYLPTQRNQMDWGQFPPEYQYTANSKLNRWAKEGRHQNIDLEFEKAA